MSKENKEYNEDDLLQYIDWEPNPDYQRRNLASGIESLIVKRVKEDKGLLSLFTDILAKVRENPYLCTTHLANEIGYGDYSATIAKYLTRNPRFVALLNEVRKNEFGTNTIKSAGIIRDILNEWKKHIASGNAKLVMWAVDKQLTHSSAKELGFSGEATSGNQVVILDRTKKLPEFSNKELENV